jgi:hypothetical protein
MKRFPTDVWKRWIRSKRPLDSPARFRKVLGRERACADLSGQPLSLLTFAARERESAEATFQELEQILKRRLRCTDAVGWLDGEHLAVALPSTPREGAAQVADDICVSFPIHRLPPFCEIYCYPADHLPGELLLEDSATGKRRATLRRSSVARHTGKHLLVGEAAEK